MLSGGCGYGVLPADPGFVKADALWEFSYHTDSDKRRVEKFCEELEIDTGCVNTFKM